MTSTVDLSARTSELLAAVGAAPLDHDSGLAATSPITGAVLGHVPLKSDVDSVIAAAADAYRSWSLVPAPVRGGLVRELGELLREHKDALGELVSIEAGKIVSEGLGEVQEMIDICDFGVGLSRQLYGNTIATERPGHRMMEQWHPLGVVAVITAFNFPVAVWSWNTVLALVAGDTVVWKPSEKTPVTAVAVQALFEEAARRAGVSPAVAQLVVGDRAVGETLVDDPRIALVSATGSTRMGREVGPRVAARFGRVLLELGGNNAAIVCPSADLDLTVRGLVFSAAGTAGQRCTSLRRVIVHESVADTLVDRLGTAYSSLPVGSPLDSSTLVGPLIDEAAHDGYADALELARKDGGTVVAGGERVRVAGAEDGVYVQPAIVRMPAQTDVVRRETFAPILYVMTYSDLDEAIALHNDVPQGLSSSIFTTDLREAERFLSAAGSDCGIANVNIGPSGAEIGGAFGGEKETGGGRESGSDAWKSYMRRTTNTVNYSSELPLAQGVTFL
ncbi:aldehyde dehydrogenase family protein [Rhodococcus sp. BP-349]|uniref:L-piperidine-6-carboxylate dehydrogenase n=1 Tax=unclassified Rhodococcus (in: high G+C Gram-positive bacteria) TaxID=192944 RepID=UPI001C9AED35|nr:MULTISPECIES: aldehyde dehydrogenase family protein [unclassified Rhodococcus (in: high G+C Gram-positive bacteria)]MBY6539129.1 aldehyde dehydrogenase family protein [Rhodococcus sp. BP-363]MBY6544543.1 aldehyde dehydrogenase family protein [Rhodococcus sp. BP-369]MBY6563773.1 aldehyde dehydrogenase family protein [Rhodococcus sp. BP-370]MBY6578065.1 aldehyde dehydrogenase family protein [Rhodococcus sp. BP-364]MBY6587366.1 aldehyde dehydrogenase family protein [Rhodococcus sp. BP-358]